MFLIELKSIEKINQQGFKKLLDNVYNKFITSRKILDLLFQIISTNSKKQINIQKMQIHDILVIPDAYKISALLKNLVKKLSLSPVVIIFGHISKYKKLNLIKDQIFRL